MEASKREVLLNWYDAKKLTIGKCTDVLMGHQESQQKADELFFSLQKERALGQKTVDFEAKSVKHRNKICFEILDAISKRRGIEAFALGNAKKVILEELKHKNQVIVKLEKDQFTSSPSPAPARTVVSHTETEVEVWSDSDDEAFDVPHHRDVDVYGDRGRHHQRKHEGDHHRSKSKSKKESSGSPLSRSWDIRKYEDPRNQAGVPRPKKAKLKVQRKAVVDDRGDEIKFRDIDHILIGRNTPNLINTPRAQSSGQDHFLSIVDTNGKVMDIETNGHRDTQQIVEMILDHNHANYDRVQPVRKVLGVLGPADTAKIQVRGHVPSSSPDSPRALSFDDNVMDNGEALMAQMHRQEMSSCRWKCRRLQQQLQEEKSKKHGDGAHCELLRLQGKLDQYRRERNQYLDKIDNLEQEKCQLKNQSHKMRKLQDEVDQRRSEVRKYRDCLDQLKCKYDAQKSCQSRSEENCNRLREENKILRDKLDRVRGDNRSLKEQVNQMDQRSDCAGVSVANWRADCGVSGVGKFGGPKEDTLEEFVRTLMDGVDGAFDGYPQVVQRLKIDFVAVFENDDENAKREFEDAWRREKEQRQANPQRKFNHGMSSSPGPCGWRISSPKRRAADEESLLLLNGRTEDECDFSSLLPSPRSMVVNRHYPVLKAEMLRHGPEHMKPLKVRLHDTFVCIGPKRVDFKDIEDVKAWRKSPPCLIVHVQKSNKSILLEAESAAIRDRWVEEWRNRMLNPRSPTGGGGRPGSIDVYLN